MLSAGDLELYSRDQICYRALAHPTVLLIIAYKHIVKIFAISLRLYSANHFYAFRQHELTSLYSREAV
jgi:hypothetical protein